jgi:hypothetical protein
MWEGEGVERWRVVGGSGKGRVGRMSSKDPYSSPDGASGMSHLCGLVRMLSAWIVRRIYGAERAGSGSWCPGIDVGWLGTRERRG